MDRVRGRVRVGLGLGVCLGASKLLIADCRYAICGDRVPVADTGYTTNKICAADDVDFLSKDFQLQMQQQ